MRVMVATTGIDDHGEPLGEAVTLTLAGGASRTMSASSLESGEEGLTGTIGDRKGKWQPVVHADRPLHVMNLNFKTTSGYLVDLSSTPRGNPLR